MIAGALIGQLLVTLSQVPAVTKYGIETLGSTKPQLGVRGSIVALIFQYMTLIGWNLVLTIFLGRAIASVLVAIGAISEAQSGTTAIVASLIGTGCIWLLLQKGSDGVKSISAVVASVIIVLGVWMYYLLFQNFALPDIAAAEPLGPNEGGRLTNYTTALELLMVSTLGLWAYMGAMFRMMNHAGKGTIPSMVSLGFGWAAAGLIGLYSGLIAGSDDPTVWILTVAGANCWYFCSYLRFTCKAGINSCWLTCCGARGWSVFAYHSAIIMERQDRNCPCTHDGDHRHFPWRFLRQYWDVYGLYRDHYRSNDRCSNR